MAGPGSEEYFLNLLNNSPERARGFDKIGVRETFGQGNDTVVRDLLGYETYPDQKGVVVNLGALAEINNVGIASHSLTELYFETEGGSVCRLQYNREQGPKEKRGQWEMVIGGRSSEAMTFHNIFLPNLVTGNTFEAEMVVNDKILNVKTGLISRICVVNRGISWPLGKLRQTDIALRFQQANANAAKS